MLVRVQSRAPSLTRDSHCGFFICLPERAKREVRGVLVCADRAMHRGHRSNRSASAVSCAILHRRCDARARRYRCPGQPNGFPAVSIPPSIDISSASSAAFQAHDKADHGVFIVELRWDGGRAAIITPTADIDAALRLALADFAKRITVKDTIAGCGQAASVLLIQFDVPSGATRFSQTNPPPRPFSGGVPLSSAPQNPISTATPAYSAFGSTPDASGTACPGEGDAGRTVAFPKRIELTPDSVAYFHTHNGVPGPVFIVTLRLDGVAAIAIPARLVIDDGTRATLTDFARRVTIRPPIQGCARPAGIFIAAVSLTTGTVSISVPPRPGAAPPSASP